jgi:hypothetical protein
VSVKTKIRLGKALWRNGTGDIPVEVIKELGEFDGEVYYQVKSTVKGFEGTTGVPSSELIQRTTFEKALESIFGVLK